MTIEELLKSLQVEPEKPSIPNTKDNWRKIGEGNFYETVDISEWISENPYEQAL